MLLAIYHVLRRRNHIPEYLIRCGQRPESQLSAALLNPPDHGTESAKLRHLRERRISESNVMMPG